MKIGWIKLTSALFCSYFNVIKRNTEAMDKNTDIIIMVESHRKQQTMKVWNYIFEIFVNWECLTLWIFTWFVIYGVSFLSLSKIPIEFDTQFYLLSPLYLFQSVFTSFLIVAFLFDKEVCYNSDGIGCFSNAKPYTNANGKLPESPAHIQVGIC